MTHAAHALVSIAALSTLTLTSCLAKRSADSYRGARLSSFVVGEFKPLPGDPQWDKVEVSLTKPKAKSPTAIQSFYRQDFSSGSAKNISLEVAQGSYTITMEYSGTDGKILYDVCAKDKEKVYDINTPQFTTSLAICKIASDKPSGTVDVTPMSNVTINPVAGDQAQSGGGAQNGSAKPSPGCALDNADTGVQNVTINVGNANRTMIRVVSPTYTKDRAYALVIGFHGYGLDGTSPRRDHKWPIIEELGKDEAIFIYPNAAGGSWNPGSGSADFALFDAIVASTADKFCVDKNRVFIHGFSNGSYFVNALAAARPDAVRAVISVAGGGTGSKKPAMVIHGKSDGTVGFVQAPGLVSSYAAANGCQPAPNTSSVGNDTCKKFDGCPEDFPLWFCTWNGGHHWPEFSLPTVWQFISSQK